MGDVGDDFRAIREAQRSAECPAGCKDVTVCEAADPQKKCPLSGWWINVYIARVYRNGKAIYIGQPHPSREEAAIEAFTKYPYVTTCSTGRATKIDGEWSDRGGFDIQFHTRHTLGR